MEETEREHEGKKKQKSAQDGGNIRGKVRIVIKTVTQLGQLFTD